MNQESRVIAEATAAYLATINLNNLPSRRDRAELQFAQNDIAYRNENAKATSKSDYLKRPNNITPWQIAKIMLATEPIRCIKCVPDATDSEHDLLGIYQDFGPNTGTYDTSDLTFSKIIREYNNMVTKQQIDAIKTQLLEEAQHVSRCEDPDLIAVNNGIFNFRTKQLEPFDPNKVFLSKSHVNYNPNAQPINMFNPADNSNWDVDSWIRELANDDPEVELCIWQVLSAIVRPNVRWNQAAFFYSTTGNNGKGTLCVLMRNLVGSSACANIPLADFSKDFMLEPLIRSTAIIVDENDVGGYIDKAGNLKAVITGDTIAINRKYKIPIYYQFHGMMVQCINEMPRIRDKSNSFYRRQLFVPFLKCFTGVERPYIKNNYLHRQDILEYVLHKVLHMTHYTLTTPKASVGVMEEYKLYNDPVRDFSEDILPQLAWDFVPFDFLYALYLNWNKVNNPSSTPQGKNTFTKDFLEVIKEYPNDWMLGPKTGNKFSRYTLQGNIVGPEPLIIEYDLDHYKNKNYISGTNPDKICTFYPKPGERKAGIIRVGSNLANSIIKSQGGTTP